MPKVRLENSFVPVAVDLHLYVPGDVSTASNYYGVETITLLENPNALHRPALKGDDTSTSLQVTLHAGKYIELLAVMDASVLNRNIEEETILFQLPMSVDDAKKQTQNDGASSLVQFTVLYRTELTPDLKAMYKSTYYAPDRPCEDVKKKKGNNNNNNTQFHLGETAASNLTTTPPAAAPALPQHKKYCLSTHMEPVSARLAYICQDEPAARIDFKLTFNLHATFENRRMGAVSGAPLEAHSLEEVNFPSCLSNEATEKLKQALFPVMGAAPSTPAEAAPNSDDDDDFEFDTRQDATVAPIYSQFKFETVPKVPPYLTAWMCGELSWNAAVVPSRAHGTIPIRVIYCHHFGASKANFTMDVAVESFKLFEEFFGTPYPLPKLDLGCVPDFPIGGQENWGLILLYEGVRTVSRLEGNATGAVATLRRLAALVAHEVSHNWFGNLVGLDWWEGIWLKEGFATYFGYYAVQQLKPEWKSMDEALSDVYSAMTVDGYVGTHPVEVEITTPGLITEVFDSISYNKGSALVSMLAGCLGEEKFTTSLHKAQRLWKYDDGATVEITGRGKRC